jgi:hypothetical protein
LGLVIFHGWELVCDGGMAMVWFCVDPGRGKKLGFGGELHGEVFEVERWRY